MTVSIVTEPLMYNSEAVTVDCASMPQEGKLEAAVIKASDKKGEENEKNPHQSIRSKALVNHCKWPP